MPRPAGGDVVRAVGRCAELFAELLKLLVEKAGRALRRGRSGELLYLLDATTVPLPPLCSHELRGEASESLAGCISVRASLGALKRVGPNPSPARLTAALWILRVDLGGYALDLPGSNVGSHGVDIGWIDAAGKLRF